MINADAFRLPPVSRSVAKKEVRDAQIFDRLEKTSASRRSGKTLWAWFEAHTGDFVVGKEGVLLSREEADSIRGKSGV